LFYNRFATKVTHKKLTPGFFFCRYEGKIGEERNPIIFQDTVMSNHYQWRALSETFIDMVVDRFIFKNN